MIINFMDNISHTGILGQRWGIRRYQNEDGTLTEEGKARYGKDNRKNPNKRQPISANQFYKENGKIIKDNFGPKNIVKNVFKVTNGKILLKAGLGSIALGQVIVKKYKNQPAKENTASIVNGLAITGGLLTTIGSYKIVKGILQPPVSSAINIKRNLDTYKTGRSHNKNEKSNK